MNLTFYFKKALKERMPGKQMCEIGEEEEAQRKGDQASLSVVSGLHLKVVEEDSSLLKNVSLWDSLWQSRGVTKQLLKLSPSALSGPCSN